MMSSFPSDVSQSVSSPDQTRRSNAISISTGNEYENIRDIFSLGQAPPLGDLKLFPVNVSAIIQIEQLQLEE